MDIGTNITEQRAPLDCEHCTKAEDRTELACGGA